jgi:Zn-dependent protease
MMAKILHIVASINVTLAALNLIPIPPLDGSKILMGLVSERTRYLLARIEPFGFFILIGLLYLGVLDSLIGFFEWVIVSIIKALLP